VKATTDGVNRLPSSLIITLGSPPSIIATTEFVVPKSIPMIFVAMNPYLLYHAWKATLVERPSPVAVSPKAMATGGSLL
jgi:hypothetical protein